MRFYKQSHRFYCGVDLHARTMYLCILATWIDSVHGLSLTFKYNCSRP